VSSGLIAIDLDGTLIDASLTIHDVDRAAIAEAGRRGWTVCLASGRMYAASKPFANALQLRAPVIVLQGAAVYDVATDKPLLVTALDEACALQAFDFLRPLGFQLQLYYGDDLYLDRIDDRARQYIALSRVEPVLVPDLRRLLVDRRPQAAGPMKLLGIDDPARVQATIPRLAAELGSRANVFRSLPMYLEVTDPHANKGFALSWLAEHLGIPLERTVAVGDADNDVFMFEVAARSFVVANGSAAAKRAAQTVVAAQDGGGVAEAIRELLGEPVRERV